MNERFLLSWDNMATAPDRPSASLTWSPLLETLPLGLVMTDAQGHYLQANSAALQILGMSRENLLSRHLLQPKLNLMSTDGSVLSAEETPGAVALRTGLAVPRQTLGVVLEDGNVRWLDVSAQPLAEGGVLATFEDVTRHHLTEAILAARARLAELSASVLLTDLLRATLDEAEHLTGSCIGFYHFVEEDQQTLSLQAWSTRTEQEFCRAEGKGMHYPVAQAGVWVDALRARKPVIHNDYASLPHKKGLPEGHAEISRELVVPVLRGDRIVAILGVGNKPFPYGARDLQTVMGLADLSWDLTERKRVESALQASEARYRSQFEHMSQGAFRQAADGTLIDVNPAALELLGLTREEFLRRNSLSPAWDVIDEKGDPLPGDQHPSMVALRTGQKVTSQVAGILNPVSGERVWVEINAVPECRDNEPHPFQVLVTLHDITARRRAEAATEEQQKRTEAIFNTTLECLFLTDANTQRLVEVNPAFTALTGFPREEVLGLTTRELNLWWDPAERRAYLEAIQAHGKAELTLTRIRTRDGKLVWGQANSLPLHIDAGRFLLHTVRNVTAQVEAEQALRESETRWHVLVEQAGDAVELLDEEGRYLQVNEATCHSLGYSREELLGMTVMEVDPHLTLDTYRNQFYASLDQPAETYETHHRRKDGSLFPVEITASTFQLEGQARILAHVRDITERKRAELALRENEARLRAIVACSCDAIGVSKVGIHIMVNPAYLDMFGFAPDDDLSGTSVLDLIAPENREEVAQRARDRAEGKPVPNQYDIKGLRRDQSTFDLSVHASSYKLDDDLYTVVILRDITALKMSERALRHSEEQYRGLFDSMGEGFALHEILTDDEGRPIDYRFLDVNPAFVAMTGIPREKWIGHTVLEVLPGTETRWIHEYGQVALTGRSVTFENEAKKLGHWYRVTAYRPAPRQFAVLVTDITERKRRDVERHQLEHQMARAQKMESLGSLAGGVAHDMNNVLGAIMGLASLHLEQAPEDSRLHKSMDTILKACTRGRTLVKGLLGFARQGLEEVQVLDLNEIVLEEVTLLERTIPTNVAIELDLAPDLHPILGDSASLSHLLMNLCVNALDAMPEGGTLRLRSTSVGSDSVALEVVDTGCGMAPDVLEKALDPFFTTKAQGKGTGLGLSIVYGVVKAHRGRLEISSTPSMGTQVLMTFPATVGLCTIEPAGDPSPPSGQPLKILVVDDDELIQDSMGELLRSMGHLPVPAPNGETALRLLKEGLSVDALVLDLNMPGLGGAGTLPLLRVAYPDLPVVLATGKADQVAIDLAARTPRTLLLPKPFSGREIAAVLQQLGLS